jgi:serine/threonine-protein kinase
VSDEPHERRDTLVDALFEHDGAATTMRPEDVEDPLLGSFIERRFQVLGLLAIGGMGHVYSAYDHHTAERVALKTLKPELAAQPAVVQRFVREAAALARTQSPHVVRIAHHGRLPDGRAYYAMEYLDGRNLQSVMSELGGPMPPGRAIRIALQLAAALERAHAIGIVHRDLKPENVLLCPQPDGSELVKVLDFGLAKAADGSMDVTVAGEVVGTPGYMAPEQIQGRTADARTDVYAFGVVLYEMLTGRLPFQAEGLMQMLVAHVTEPPPLLSQLGLGVKLPTVLEWITMCCLYKEPERRFQSASELRSELENVARLYRLV